MTDNCGKKKLFDRKTLADAVPDIDKYWDKEKNDGKSPSDFSRTSSEKVWTKCPICGTLVKRNVRFTWEADENGVGHVIHCRTCGKRNKENSLVLIVPEIKKYWVYEKNEHGPEYYTISSGKRVYVKCPHCGKERYIAVADATRQNKNNRYYVTACDDCAKKEKVLSRRQRTNILEKCPDVYDYWDETNIFTPLELTVSDIERIYTHCPICGDLMERRALSSFVKGDDGYWHVKRCAKCILKEANGKKAMALRGPVIDECPEIGEWWDDELNGFGPDEVTRGSHYEAFFRCPACHAVRHRSVHKFLAVHRDGSLRPVACPECGYSSAKGDPEDNLVKLCPEIEDWWNYEKNAPFRPEQFSKGSQFRAYLVCPDCGLELYSGIHALLHTTDDGTVVISHNGRCRKYRAMESENNLVAQYPEVEDWWDYKKNYPHKPEEYTLFSPHKMHFKCPNCGQESYKRIKDAFNTNDLGYPRLFKCAYCEGMKPIRGKNSLAALYPEIAAQCISTDDTERIFPSASSRMKWKCEKCGGTWFDLVVNRVNGQGCPYCEDRAALPGFNSLKDVKPELMPEWSENNERLPDEFLPTSYFRAIWKCPTCGHEYEAKVKDREVGDDSCPYCTGKKVLPGFNSLKAVKPELSLEWSDKNEQSADEILPTSWMRALWECPTCGGEYEAAVKDREVGDDSCPYCAGKKVLPGFNSLKAVKPELSLEWSDKNEQSADEILPTSWMRALWECPTCGGEYEAAVKDREVGDDSCPYCTGKKVLPGFNSLKIKKPDLLEEWSDVENMFLGIDPDQILDTYDENVWWECQTCGQKYMMSVKDRLMKQKRGHEACPNCKGRRWKKTYVV